jgi:NAD(P)-dependent dehydrogenase (short-subunit alcohol dehydrogenase family)
MEINLLGPALLSDLLLPILRGDDSRPRGRIVNVAAAVYGTSFSSNTTIEYLTQISKELDPVLNSTG